MPDQRRLCHAVANPVLDHYYRKETGKCKKSMKSVVKWQDKYHDLGASHYLNTTRMGSEYDLPHDRENMAIYAQHASVKLQALTSLVHQICTKKRRKLLIFCDWPLVQWQLEWFLVNIGYNVIGIRASHKHSEREAAVKAFNDKKPGRLPCYFDSSFFHRIYNEIITIFSDGS